MRRGKSAALLTAISLLGYAAVRGRVRRYEIAESSMEPALQAGDYVVALPLRGPLTRGDIIIFEHPRVPGYELVKRVIGLPGEKVVISGGQVHCSDATVAEPWADGPTIPDGRWDLEPGEVFVLGDNRSVSAADSRTLGPLDLRTAKWRVAARYWPPQSIGRIGN